MKKLSILLLCLIFVFLSYGVFLSRSSLDIYKTEIEPLSPLGFYDYAGVTNVHTLKKLGKGSALDVVAAAQAADLDFIFITNLNSFNATEKAASYQDQTLVLVGGEFSYLDSRLLAFNLPRHSNINSLAQAQTIFTDYLNTPASLNQNTPILVLAHPFKPGYTWNRNFPPGLSGLEIINLKTIWQKKWLFSKASFFWTLFAYPFNPRLAMLLLVEPPQQEIALWDRLNKKWPTFGVAGVDADPKTLGIAGTSFSFPSYEEIFKITKNHILLQSELTGDPIEDVVQIKRALKNGQFYFSFDLLADPTGFSTFISDLNSNIFPMGSRIKYQKDLAVVVRLPHQLLVPYEIILMRNGQQVAASKNREVHFSISSPGVYRVVVRVQPTYPLPPGKTWIPWIYSNPYYLKP